MSMVPPDMVRDARDEYQQGNRKAALDLIDEARHHLSPCRIYQLLGEDATADLLGVQVNIRCGKSVIILSHSS